MRSMHQTSGASLVRINSKICILSRFRFLLTLDVVLQASGPASPVHLHIWFLRTFNCSILSRFKVRIDFNTPIQNSFRSIPRVSSNPCCMCTSRQLNLSRAAENMERILWQLEDILSCRRRRERIVRLCGCFSVPRRELANFLCAQSNRVHFLVATPKLTNLIPAPSPLLVPPDRPRTSQL
jgi:hypothetical protein